MVGNLVLNDSDVCTYHDSSEYEFINLSWKGLSKNRVVVLGPSEFKDDKFSLFLDLEMCKRLRDWLNAVIEENE